MHAAGQEEFDAITRTYYRGAGAAVIAFSTTDRASFDAIGMWKNKIEQECGDIAVALVQNKVDLVDQAVVTASEVEGAARKLGLKLYRTCVKENINVTEVFIYLAELNQRKATAAPAQHQGHGTPSAEVAGGTAGAGAKAEGNFRLEPTADRPEENDRARTIELGPSKKRTKGKKSMKDRMASLSCSVA